MNQPQITALAHAAIAARSNSYSPYSHFCVGAALLCAGPTAATSEMPHSTAKNTDETAENCTLYTGCNIENSAYSPSLCAERVAFAKAVSEKAGTPLAIAIVGGPADASSCDFCPPCGVCRQVMREFCSNDFIIILVQTTGNTITATKQFTLAQLLPESFAL